MNNSSNRNNFIFILLFGVLVGGYFLLFKKSNSSTQATTEEVKTAETVEAASSSNPQVFKKLNAYLSCINRNRERARDSYKRYASWLKDIEAGPTGKESIKYGLYTIYGPEHYCEKLAENKALSPAMPDIETKSEGYLSAMKNLEALLIQANKYYDSEDWKDDAMQKGKAMHSPLLAAFKSYFESENALIAAIEARGKTEKQTINPIVSEISTNIFLLNTMITPDLPNPDKMKTTIEALENGINALVASPDYKGNYESLENAASSIVKDAKKIMREAREKKTEKWSKRDFNRNITDWIEAYNQMKPEDSFLKKVVFAGE